MQSNKSWPLIAIPFLGLSLLYISPFHKSISKTVQSSQSEEMIVARLSSNQRNISADFMCFNVNSVRVESWENPKFISAVKGLAPSVLRIPGGQVANYWDWRVGGLTKNLQNLPEGLPFFLKNKKDRSYQSSKLINYKNGFESTGTAPLFVLNMLSSSLEDQLEMLQAAEELGMPVKEIELGNELYFSTRNNRAIFPYSNDYAQTALKWTNEIKQLYPAAKISVVGDVKIWPNTLKFKPRRDYWNRTILSNKSNSFDAISLHIYSENALDDKSIKLYTEYPFFSKSDVPIILGEPFRNWGMLRKENEFRIIPDDKKIWITEYNLHEKGHQNRGGLPRVAGSWAHGLYTLAMSMVFLEDPRVDKICNHMLIGSSQFSAIYADDKSFQNPNGSNRTTAFGQSASGTSLQLFGEALDSAEMANQIEFLNTQMLSGKEQFKYSALYGWYFSKKDGENRAIIINLSSSSVETDIKGLFQGEVSVKQKFGSPRTLVTGPDIMNESIGQASAKLQLPAYSVTLLEE